MNDKYTRDFTLTPEQEAQIKIRLKELDEKYKDFKGIIFKEENYILQLDKGGNIQKVPLIDSMLDGTYWCNLDKEE